MTPVPECQSRKPTPEAPSALRVQRVILSPEDPECDACPETPGEPRMHPDAPRVRSRETLPGTFRVRHARRAPTPSDYPQALGEHATCPRERFFFRRILENTQ